MSHSESNLVYEIDKYNVIRKIAGSWEAFCEENDTLDLGEEKVVGRCLWDFVIGKDVRWLYEKVLQQVRETGGVVKFPFRCDSPDTVRLMHMEIAPQGEQSVRFVTTPLEIRKRPRHIYYNYVAHGHRCHIFSCSICNRVKTDSAWLQLDEALHARRLLDNDKPLSLYGALCPECKAKMDMMMSRSS